MIRDENQGIVLYSYELFRPFPQVVNIVTTRIGGVSRDPLSSLNLSFSKMVDDEEQAVIINRSRLYNLINIKPEHVAQAELVHGSNVEIVSHTTPCGTFEKLSRTDGLITALPNTALLIPVADCAAISFFDPQAHIVAMIHAGWRGATRGIISETVEKMSTLGSHPSDILVGISPILKSCCYQVRQDMVDAVTRAFPTQAQAFFVLQADDIHYQFDFLAMLRWCLEESGILPHHMEDSGICTSCSTSEFYSYRAEQGPNGRTGRFAGLIVMRE
ncbi:laccase domain protein YlmD [Reticulibacter mediterranei]|uniref:Purine nucleoside phosphorylase n=1 Tax=Reticulibacter mediterranei TaxID=2778369 RepID=A0A8J3NAW1_9CHLR|nr:peptidoglycan editing factor PgeF [Reticulibacter mediterranei]GHP00818.1 laccase domain protein YlmD [Reticulibacter mediterranei]